MGGGTDVLTQLDRGILPADEVVDLRALGLSGIAHDGDGVRIGATTSVAEVERDPGIGERFAGLQQAAAAVGSPQLREMGTVGGNLCQQVRCWYFRHPDLQCWLRGGETCYAQIGDHRKHGLEPGDCISVAPSDLAAALLAMDAQVETSTRRMPLADLYRRASAEQRSTLTLEPGEFVAAVEVPRAPGRQRLRDRGRAGRVELRAGRRRGRPVRRRRPHGGDRRLEPAPADRSRTTRRRASPGSR